MEYHSTTLFGSKSAEAGSCRFGPLSLLGVCCVSGAGFEALAISWAAVRSELEVFSSSTELGGVGLPP